MTARFREAGSMHGVAAQREGMEQAGMGVGIGDYDLDGYLDIFKTHFSEDTNVLYRNNGKGNFEDVTIRAGLGVETRFIGWGAGIEDFDNDGYPDLFCDDGHVFPGSRAQSSRNVPYKTPRVLFRNLGNGKFEELIRGWRDPGCRRRALQPWRRLRRFRQRRRSRHPHHQSERAAISFAQRS